MNETAHGGSSGARARGAWIRAAAAIAALIVAVVFGLAWTWPPRAVGASAPATEFSSARALVHVAAIAQRPHRIGSAEHAKVRAYIVGELRALGLEPAIQEAIVDAPMSWPLRMAAVKNVIAKRRGTGSGKALLLVAHYDSRTMTPGASDDGFGVAALLETARALGAGPPSTSDVIFLFTDGEEEGLFGARAFVEHHPWAADVGLVLNFEARGDAGPVLAFQTSDDNGRLIRELARVAPYPAASSLSQAIYRRMPNDTDLSEWLPRRASARRRDHAPEMAAINFANIGGFERYHAPTDTVEALDERTLQHHGSYALSLARAFASHELPLEREPSSTYFNVGPILVRYPASWDLPIAVAVWIFLAAFAVDGRRRGVLRAPYALLGVLVAIAIAAASAVICAIAWTLAKHAHAGGELLNAASPAMKALYLAAFVAVALSIALAAQAALAKRTRAIEIFAGGAAIWAALGTLVAASVPGASFVFTAPLLVALPIAIGLASEEARDRASLRAAIVAIAVSVAPLVVAAPLVVQLVAAFGPDAAPIAGGLVALLAVLAAPAARIVIEPAPRAAPLAAFAIAIACYAGASLRAPFDRGHPRPATILLAVDGDTERAFWITTDERRGATAGRAPPIAFPITSDVDLFTTDAGASRERGPAIDVIEDAPQGAGRSLRLRVTPPEGAEVLAVHVGGVIAATVAGQRVGLEGDALALRFYAPPASGVEIAITTRSRAVTVRALSQRAGFPSSATPPARAPDTMPTPGMMPPWNDLLESDMTIVARTLTR